MYIIAMIPDWRYKGTVDISRDTAEVLMRSVDVPAWTSPFTSSCSSCFAACVLCCKTFQRLFFSSSPCGQSSVLVRGHNSTSGPYKFSLNRRPLWPSITWSRSSVCPWADPDDYAVIQMFFPLPFSCSTVAFRDADWVNALIRWVFGIRLIKRKGASVWILNKIAAGQKCSLTLLSGPIVSVSVSLQVCEMATRAHCCLGPNDFMFVWNESQCGK